MTPRVALLGLAAAGIAAAPAAGAAQASCDAYRHLATRACRQDHVVLATVAPILRLDLGTVGPALLAPDRLPLDGGGAPPPPDERELSTGPTVRVRANRPWVLKMMAAAASSDDPDPVYRAARTSGVPAAELAWSLSQVQGFAPLDPATSADVASSVAAGSNAQHVIYFRTRWIRAADAPGLHGLHITFTLTGS